MPKAEPEAVSYKEEDYTKKDYRTEIRRKEVYHNINRGGVEIRRNSGSLLPHIRGSGERRVGSGTLAIPIHNRPDPSHPASQVWGNNRMKNVLNRSRAAEQRRA